MRRESTYEKYILWYDAEVSLADVYPFLPGGKSVIDAVNTFLKIKEENWEKENPEPKEARFIQSWFINKLNSLYPSYQFLVDGYEIGTEEALKLNIYTWNIKIKLIFDQELGEIIEKEKEEYARR